eukprot:GEMP01042830.1.p1 GENE.GEMP01042830.1~~GEMP01042830.1.p1  ORF type:complete len:366 (+),score=67.98 GEMP01042830.1:173-1270(+)
MSDWGYYNPIATCGGNWSPWYDPEFPVYADPYRNSYPSGSDWNRESARGRVGRVNIPIYPARKAPHVLTDPTSLDVSQGSDSPNKGGYPHPTTPQPRFPMDFVGWPTKSASAPPTPPAHPAPHARSTPAHVYLETKPTTLGAPALNTPIRAVFNSPPVFIAPSNTSFSLTNAAKGSGECSDEASEAIKLLSRDAAKPKTTMMLRNIPNKYTQKMLLKYLESNGFRGTFDFFYLPIDFRNRCNVGYAFINFTAVCHAERFLKVLHHVKLPAYNSNKVCEVTHAHVQGLEQNIEHYRNSPVNGVPVAAYRPLIFKGGVEIGFPKPDAPLPPIQLRPAKVQIWPGELLTLNTELSELGFKYFTHSQCK